MGEGNVTITERRRQTRNKMYRYIYDSRTPVSKQQLAKDMGYSLPTVQQNIAELLSAGLIRPGEIQKQTGGRPAVGYTVEEGIRYSIGISVSSTNLRILATNILQDELAYKKVRIPVFEEIQVGRQIADELEIFLEEQQIPSEKILGVGLTFPGVVDREKDTIVLSPTMRMKNISLSDVRELIPYPVFIENDSTSGGNAEWFGLSPEERTENFVYLFLENGIGGAVFINGHPYLGSEGRSGEFGHMCLQPEGRLCYCGEKGCLEAYCSAYRFTRDLGISAEEFFAGLEEGNAEYKALWEEILEYLAIAVNNLRMAFDCNVILGGFVSGYIEPYLPVLREKAAALSPFDTDGSYIRLGRYPIKAGMMGVAWHFTKQFIDEI